MPYTTEQVMSILRRELPYFSREFNVRRIGLFGSYAKGTQREDSDIDIVVEFDGFVGLKCIRFVDYLEGLFGKKVDVVTSGGITSIRHRDVAESIRNDMVYA
jgi:predicted nucleotidyltransferase